MRVDVNQAGKDRDALRVQPGNLFAARLCAQFIVAAGFRDESIFNDERAIAQRAQSAPLRRVNEPAADAEKRSVHARGLPLSPANRKPRLTKTTAVQRAFCPRKFSNGARAVSLIFRRELFVRSQKPLDEFRDAFADFRGWIVTEQSA